MAIVATKSEELQQARKDGKLVIEEKPRLRPGMPSIEEMEQMAMAQAGMHSTDVSQENVRQACIAMSELIHRQGNGRSRISVMTHLPGEMRKVLKGRTGQEAFDFYWSLPQFQKVWAELGFTDATLRDYVNKSLKELGRVSEIGGNN